MLETRSYEGRVEYQERADGGGSLKGLAAPYYDGSSRTEFVIHDELVERIAPGAFDDINADIMGLYNHDENEVLGRTIAGTMKVTVTDRGLEYEIPDLPKSRQALSESIHRGDVRGSSFAFQTEESDRTISFEGGLRIITVTGIKFVRDLGPATFPAYVATSSSFRSKYVEQVNAEFNELATLRKFQREKLEQLDAIMVSRPSGS